MEREGSPRDRRHPGSLGVGQGPQTGVHHRIEGSAQIGIRCTETSGLEQLQRRLLLGLQPQQGRPPQTQQPLDLLQGFIHGGSIEHGSIRHRGCGAES